MVAMGSLGVQARLRQSIPPATVDTGVATVSKWSSSRGAVEALALEVAGAVPLVELEHSEGSTGCRDAKQLGGNGRKTI